MSDEPGHQPPVHTGHEEAEATRPRAHLRIVPGEESASRPGTAARPSARPRTIGRLIAQTALIADSAVTRRKLEPQQSQRGMAGRLLGRFR